MFSVLLLCFLLASCGEEKEKTIQERAEAGDAEAPPIEDSKTMVRKILCLHGGGGDAKKFQFDSGITDLKNALGNGYEFVFAQAKDCLLYTSPSPRDRSLSRMPSSA